MFKDWQYPMSRNMIRIDTIHSLGPPFMDLEAEKDGSLRANGLFLPLSPLEEVMKENIFTVTDKYMKNLVGYFVLAMLFS